LYCNFIPNIEQAGYFKISTIYLPASKGIIPVISLCVNKNPHLKWLLWSSSD